MLRDTFNLILCLVATLLLLPFIVAIAGLAMVLLFIPCCIAFTIMSFKTLQEYIKPL